MGIYSIRDLEFYYPEQDRKILDNINIDISQGEFIVLMGPSGCGKTTFLRQLKPSISPHGLKQGHILFKEKKLKDLNQKDEASEIGFVFQNPDNQIVTDKVWHELAFGLESLGYDSATIKLRVAEMASYFGIQNWFYKDVSELSGGQKQILNLAAIMCMQPSVLILDEPTSQLDPIAASDFLSTIAKINTELGITVILTEHRLEESMPLADRVVVMDKGKIIADGEPRKIAKEIQDRGHKMFLAMPTPMRIHAAVDNKGDSPLTVREGRAWLDNYSKKHALNPVEDISKDRLLDGELSVKIDEAWFKYDENLPDIIKGVSLKAKSGELLAILGGNGTGKTTVLSLIAGINKPYRGKVYIKGNDISKIADNIRYRGLIGVLPQEPKSLFVKKTVELDLYEILKGQKIEKKEELERINRVVKFCNLSQVLKQHPYDISGGEQQRAALAKILLLEPEILLLDEPTKGMDAEYKQQFAAIINKLLEDDKTVIMVSHDVEFCAEYADRCALFFDGKIVTEDNPRKFFSGNSFYTTTANRMSRHIIPRAITADEVIESCGVELFPRSNEKIDLFEENLENPEDAIKSEEILEKKVIPTKNQIIRIISFILFLFSSFKLFPLIFSFTSSKIKGKSADIGYKMSLGESADSIWIVLFVVSFIVLNLTILKKNKDEFTSPIEIGKDQGDLSKRSIVAKLSILLLIPLTIFIGIYYLGDRKYHFISILIILEIMIPFSMIFEGRKAQARELVIISVLCAIGVAGRAAFFMIPQFKPVAAIVIISAVAFGAESGFLVGAMTMLLSNMIYSQGPWTPWQMFAMGIIGFLGGMLFTKGFLRRDKFSLALFGGVSVFIIYGGIMNAASVLMFQPNINWNMIIAAWITGIPFDIIHSASTVFFLIFIGEPMLEKLDRIKIKYGLID